MEEGRRRTYSLLTGRRRRWNVPALDLLRSQIRQRLFLPLAQIRGGRHEMGGGHQRPWGMEEQCAPARVLAAGRFGDGGQKLAYVICSFSQLKFFAFTLES
uniref:Uncharacterized protein n=1 Tax=Leersia perrieri TaxID=77586 RepID=A0A0D9W3Z1_9ORYZ